MCQITVVDDAKEAQKSDGAKEAEKGDGARRKPLFVAGNLCYYLFNLAWLCILILGSYTIYRHLPESPREVTPDSVQTRFSDVKGCDEAKAELQDIVRYLREPGNFTHLGARLPRGILLTGPPGSGKTLLARAVAGEAGVPFFHTSGSSFEEVYVGVGASRVRTLFAAAKKTKQPSIIFIDELDAVGGKRSAYEGGASRQTINQLLVAMDGFDLDDKVIVMAATNFHSVLDPALLRPGRFDRHVEVALPDVQGRYEILKLYAKNIVMDATDADLLQIARGTPGSSGADLFNLINSASLHAAKLQAVAVTLKHLEAARDKILMGAELTSRVMSEASRRTTAYHEGGHALVALKTNGSYPIHKATIMPRGGSLGMVSQLPESDVYTLSRQELFARLDVCMGGRAAEALIFGEGNVTTGAADDLRQASDIAQEMVLRYGMGSTLLSLDIERLSPETRRLAEVEMKQLLSEAYGRAYGVLQANLRGLHRLADALLNKETLTAAEIHAAVLDTASLEMVHVVVQQISIDSIGLEVLKERA